MPSFVLLKQTQQLQDGCKEINYHPGTIMDYAPLQG